MRVAGLVKFDFRGRGRGENQGERTKGLMFWRSYVQKNHLLAPKQILSFHQIIKQIRLIEEVVVPDGFAFTVRVRLYRTHFSPSAVHLLLTFPSENFCVGHLGKLLPLLFSFLHLWKRSRLCLAMLPFHFSLWSRKFFFSCLANFRLSVSWPLV